MPTQLLAQEVVTLCFVSRLTWTIRDQGARTILIGRFRHDILYEGIGALFFSCGRMGHWKNYCPYTVREAEVEMEKTGESAPKRNDDEVAGGTNLEGK